MNITFNSNYSVTPQRLQEISDTLNYDGPMDELDAGITVEYEHNDIWKIPSDKYADLPFTEDELYAMISIVHIKEAKPKPKPQYYELLSVLEKTLEGS